MERGSVKGKKSLFSITEYYLDYLIIYFLQLKKVFISCYKNIENLKDKENFNEIKFVLNLTMER